jgi:hypothetical protein
MSLDAKPVFTAMAVHRRVLEALTDGECWVERQLQQAAPISFWVLKWIARVENS